MQSWAWRDGSFFGCGLCPEMKMTSGRVINNVGAFTSWRTHAQSARTHACSWSYVFSITRCLLVPAMRHHSRVGGLNNARMRMKIGNSNFTSCVDFIWDEMRLQEFGPWVYCLFTLLSESYAVWKVSSSSAVLLVSMSCLHEPSMYSNFFLIHSG